MADEEGDPAGRENGVYGSATSRKGDENSLDRLTGGDEQRTKSRGTCQAHPELWGSGRKTDKDPWPLAHPNPPPPSLSKNGLVSVCVCAHMRTRRPSPSTPACRPGPPLRRMTKVLGA